MSQVSTRLSPQDLREALEQRDGALLAAHSLRWAHRHGVEALESLIQDQALDETARLWWREQLVSPTPAAVGTQALLWSQPAEAVATSSATEPLLTHPVDEDSVPLPAEWLVPTRVEKQQQHQPEPELEPAAAAIDDGEAVEPEVMHLDVAEVEPAAFEPVAAEPSGLEPAAASAPEPLPPLAEAFGPIPGLEPLPSFNVQAIFAMQSELAERPLAPPIVPPVMAAVLPEELQLEAFPTVEAQFQNEIQTELQAEPLVPLKEELSAEAIPIPTALIPAASAPAEQAPEKPAPPRRNPFSRLRGLLKDCVEEVASTFGNDDESAFKPVEPAAASAEAPLIGEYQAAPDVSAPPHPFLDAFPSQPPAPRAPIAPPPFALQQPPQPTRQDQGRWRGERNSSSGRGARSNRPAPGSTAPAPSHPALDSLRSWLPDALEQDDQRQAS
ncbi:hypothetical protein KBY77_03315 [Synechococcus sp. Cruz-7E5]|nr:hypothetical protein [Synechococcus sp. Edmonson 11F2]MCP9862155.1 hypothetical protein [Synechococcus sp. Cruz-7E5]